MRVFLIKKYYYFLMQKAHKLKLKYFDKNYLFFYFGTLIYIFKRILNFVCIKQFCKKKIIVLVEQWLETQIF